MRGPFSQLHITPRRYLPHIVLSIAVSLSLFGAYFAVGLAQSSAPKVGWASNPVTISFASTSLQGSVTDSFTCSPGTSDLYLTEHASSGNIALAVTPSGFASCGSNPHTVTLTATCLVTAAQCKGTYQGLVQTRNPANAYGNIPANLRVT